MKRSIAAAAVVLGGASYAQCIPEWIGTIGQPGLGNGYAAPIAQWNEGAGERIFVGGSFSTVAGQSLVGLGRWDPATGTWSRVGAGLSFGSTNGFLTSIVAFNPGGGEELVVGGFFFSAGGVSGTKSLARWNGTRWAALGSDFDPTSASAVWAMRVFGNRLVVGGNFPTAGGVAANGIAEWDGAAWSALGSGITGSFSPNVFALAVFDDGTGGGEQLYAAGRFDTIGGASAAMIGKWNGTSWSRVGTGLIPGSSLFGLEAMTVFDDGSGPALFVAGAPFSVPGNASVNCAKWNGVAWTPIAQNVGGRTTSLAVFDDGSGPSLYAGGTAQPGINYIARLVGSQWVTVNGGVTGGAIPPSNFPSVFGLAAIGDRLYVGGNFTQIGSAFGNGLAWRTACRGCPADFNGDGQVDFFDYLDFVAAFAAEDPSADFNGDGQIDFFDYLDFVAAFAEGCD